MKKFILAALAASIAASPLAAVPALAAPQDRHETVIRHQPGRTVVVDRTVVRHQGPAFRNQEYRNWRKGQRFDYRYARNYQEIRNYRNYRLNAPPRGYHWVRSGNDAVLVALTGGLIGAVIAGAVH